MTLQERQQAAIEALVKEGAAQAGPNSYQQIATLFLPNSALPDKMSVYGIKLIVNKFVPEGRLWPLPSFKVAQELPREFVYRV